MTYRRLPSFPRPLGLGALAALGLAVTASPAGAAITLAADAAAVFEAKVFPERAQYADGPGRVARWSRHHHPEGGDIATVPAAGGDPIEDHIDVNTAVSRGFWASSRTRRSPP